LLTTKASLSSWNCDKLLQLFAELDDSHAAENTYARHALLRAILDHVPLILGHREFGQVVSNHPWSQRTRRYMKHLLTVKTQADDALHRQISKRRRRIALRGPALRAPLKCTWQPLMAAITEPTSKLDILVNRCR
jgi:hypothetical protein